MDKIMKILGTTKAHFWPFMEFEGTNVIGFSTVADLISSEAGAAEALEDDFNPQLLPSGWYAYWFNPDSDLHLRGVDDANFSFGNGTVDTPFSVGCWIFPVDIASELTMIAKYDSAGNKEEYAFRIDATTSALELELHDASASTTEIAQSDEDVVLTQWQFVVATYDGAQAAPSIGLYINGKDTNPDGASTETGAYVAMEDTTAPLTIGCAGVTATPTEEFHGFMAMPFITGKELTADEVTRLYNITRRMVLGTGDHRTLRS